MEENRTAVKLKTRKILWVGLAILIVIGLIYVTFVPRPVQVEVTRVYEGTFQDVIRTDARVRAKERYVVTAFANGDIERIALKVGDPVEKGQRITTLIWDVIRTVRAPINGVISNVYRESAGPVARGEPLVEIVDPNNLEVVAELLTSDAVRVEPGDEVILEGWGGRDPLKAKVARVSKAAFTKTSALGVEEERTEVTAEFEGLSSEQRNRLGDNYRVDATIILDQRKNATLVPIGALFRDGTAWAVYRVRNGRAERAIVEIANRNYREAMLTKGLEVGDEVILYPGDLIADNVRIRAQ